MDTVTLPKAELFAMLDIAVEMVNFCACHMGSDRYHASANAVWVIAHRASGDDATADELKASMLRKREAWLASERAKCDAINKQPQGL